MSNDEIKNHCRINNKIARIAGHAIQQLHLSVCGYTRVLKVTRTIADLESSTDIQLYGFNEALQYRPRLGKPSTARQRKLKP